MIFQQMLLEKVRWMSKNSACEYVTGLNAKQYRFSLLSISWILLCVSICIVGDRQNYRQMIDNWSIYREAIDR